MPNWCYNSLTISGTNENVNLIYDTIDNLKDNEGIFVGLIGLGDVDEVEYHNGGWYEHNLQRFGTKWDVSKDYLLDFNIEDIGNNETKLHISFSTAWSPPDNFVLAFTEKYQVSVDIQSEEGGCDYFFNGTAYKGEWLVKEVFTYNEGQYLFNKEHFWESIVESEIESFLDRGIELTNEYVKKIFPFIKNDDIKDVIEIYESNKTNRE